MTSTDDGAAAAGRRSALLHAYDSQLREDGEMSFARSVQRDGPLLRAVFDGAYGFVSYRSLVGYDAAADGGRLDDLIARTVAYFAQETQVPEFEWKTRSHDLPLDLGLRLQAQGLVAGEAESVMIGEASLLAAVVPLPTGVSLRRIGFDADGGSQPEARTRADVEQVLATQVEVFGTSSHTTDESMYTRIVEHADVVELWAAFAREPSTGREIVVTTGRLQLVPGTEFAGIWGGATLPAWRGRGIYRALTAARARSALSKGVRYLHSDSTDYSRPILERSGFLHVTSTTPYIWKRPA